MELAAHTYVSEHPQILSGAYPQALLHGQAPAARVLDTLKQVARELVFMRPEVEALELEGYAALRGVLSTYACLLALPAAQFERLLAGQGAASCSSPAGCSIDCRPVISGIPAGGGQPGSALQRRGGAGVVFPVRLLLDYVSGMTDTYALEEFRLLSGI